jgi:hypothetical protein
VSARDQGLTIEIVDGRVMISIGIDALIFAVKGSEMWEEQLENQRGWSIGNEDGFAQDIVAELEDEQEDGTTEVHLMFDRAIQRAFDQGSLNVSYGAEG